MGNRLSVSEAARRMGAKPQHISELFYRRILGDGVCPIEAGRRLIPESYLPVLADALQKRGHLKSGVASEDQ